MARDAPRIPHTVAEILESMTDAFVALDADWHYVYVNARAGELFARRPEDLVGRHIWTEFPDGVGQPFHLMYERAMRDQTPVRFEDYYPPFGRWFENHVYPSLKGLTIFFHDITDRKQAELELRRSEERYRTLASAISTAVWSTDEHGRNLGGPPGGWLTLTGQDERQAIDKWLDAVHPEDQERVARSWHRALETGEEYEERYRVRRADGSWRHVQARGIPIRDGERVREWVGIVLDVTDQHLAQEALQRAALEDNLTGLANRVLFLDRLERVLRRRERPCAGVLYLDLDAFKTVNDTRGHAAGDELLRATAARLLQVVRPSDTVARLSGDEFAVLCDDLPREREALRVAKRIVAMLAAGGRERHPEIRTTASLGVAFVRPHHVNAGEVISEADTAMYEAKVRGGNRVEVFDRTLRDRLSERVAVERELRAGLDAEGPVLHFQPIYDRAQRHALGVEALLRWRTSRGHLLEARQIIPVAEETGMIVPIGMRVLRDACATAARWPERIFVSVNLSAHQLADPGALVAGVCDALDASRLPATRLLLEITESVLMKDAELAERTLRELRALGVRLALDDFGTGYSSLSYLHRLPFDVVKLDRSFVAGLPADEGSARIIEAIVGLAHELELRVVAEGVERHEQLNAPPIVACDAVQGFLLARPLPADAATALVLAGTRMG